MIRCEQFQLWNTLVCQHIRARAGVCSCCSNDCAPTNAQRQSDNSIKAPLADVPRRTLCRLPCRWHETHIIVLDEVVIVSEHIFLFLIQSLQKTHTTHPLIPSCSPSSRAYSYSPAPHTTSHPATSPVSPKTNYAPSHPAPPQEQGRNKPARKQRRIVGRGFRKW